MAYCLQDSRHMLGKHASTRYKITGMFRDLMSREFSPCTILIGNDTPYTWKRRFVLDSYYQFLGLFSECFLTNFSYPKKLEVNLRMTLTLNSSSSFKSLPNLSDVFECGVKNGSFPLKILNRNWCDLDFQPQGYSEAISEFKLFSYF